MVNIAGTCTTSYEIIRCIAEEGNVLNLLNVGLAVEYLSAKLDIQDDTVVSVVLQGSSASSTYLP